MRHWCTTSCEFANLVLQTYTINIHSSYLLNPNLNLQNMLENGKPECNCRINIGKTHIRSHSASPYAATISCSSRAAMLLGEEQLADEMRFVGDICRNKLLRSWAS